MRNSLLVFGAILTIGSAYMLVEGGAFTSREEVVRVGDLSVSAKKTHPILPWMAWAGIAAGGVMVVVGLTRKT